MTDLFDVHRSTIDRLAPAYLIVQGFAGTIWWILMLADSGARHRFFSLDAPEHWMRTILVPDAVMFIAGSWISAWMIWGCRPRSVVVLAIHVGGVWYACLLAIGQALLDSRLWLGAAFMIPCALVVTGILLALIRATRGVNS